MVSMNTLAQGCLRRDTHERFVDGTWQAKTTVVSYCGNHLTLLALELARRLGVKHPYVIKMLSGKVNISFGAAVKLAEALGCTFDPVLRDKNGVRYSPCDDPVEESS